jgi:hypothetical protein
MFLCALPKHDPIAAIHCLQLLIEVNPAATAWR